MAGMLPEVGTLEVAAAYRGLSDSQEQLKVGISRCEAVPWVGGACRMRTCLPALAGQPGQAPKYLPTPPSLAVLV